MKASEIKPCVSCGGPLGTVWMYFHASHVLLKIREANQVFGLHQFFDGRLDLAEMFSPDPEIAQRADQHDPSLGAEAHICMQCASTKPLMVLFEQAAPALERPAEASRTA